ncbi:hypothetical protein SESBI_32676 [Sesbania bispinosa]|nr:hypothetical protein SESBI_32676 [Sesbania bispinosa]
MLVRNLAGEGIDGEAKVLEAGNGADGGREGTGEVVAVEEDVVECGGVEELHTGTKS